MNKKSTQKLPLYKCFFLFAHITAFLLVHDLGQKVHDLGQKVHDLNDIVYDRQYWVQKDM